jgi:predicted transcriptional regulator with HTH domain
LNESKERLKKMLEVMVGRVVTPGDVVALSGLPRYEVLAAFHVLEALNLVEVINEKGNYKVYKITNLGLKLLKALEEVNKATIDITVSQAQETQEVTT